MAPPKGFIPHNKKEIDMELMKKLYFKDKWDFKKIADFFGFKSKSAIYDRFKSLKLKARTNTDLKTGFKFNIQVIPSIFRLQSIRTFSVKVLNITQIRIVLIMNIVRFLIPCRTLLSRFLKRGKKDSKTRSSKKITSGIMIFNLKISSIKYSPNLKLIWH